MKKTRFALVAVAVVLAVSVVIFLLQNRQRQVEQEQVEEPRPLSFWSGEVIIGEGPNRGKIELVAAPGEKAVILTADKDGICRFDSISGMEVDEAYVRLQKRGHPPLISFAPYKEGKETEMHPVYRLSRAVKKGKITPLIAPHIMSPVERRTHQQGQYFDGFTWSVRSRGQQLYGREQKQDPDVRYASTAVELTPLVTVKLEPFEIDLAERYFTEERLAEMAMADRKFDHLPPQNKNGLREFTTSVGTFRVVSCFDRQSADPNAKNCGGWHFAILQLPNGKVINDLGIQQVLELDDLLYLVCRHHVLKWISNDKLECVVTFERLEGKWAPYISCADTKDGLFGRYLTVNKSNGGEFGGLLECQKGKWIFHRYEGDYGTWVERVESLEKGGNELVFTLFNKKQVQFDPATGTFTDL